MNEVLVGFNQIAVVNNTLDWAGIGNGNATFGIAGGQPIAGLSSIGLGGGLSSLGAGASDSDTLDRTYQINEKLTWITGRQTLKFGGQLLHYVQRRFYAGNNGLLGLFGYGGAFTGFPFSDFLLDQVSSKGRGSLTSPWTHLHNRSALFVQDDFKITSALTLNLGMRWAYTQPVYEKDNRQGNFDLTTGKEILASDDNRPLYNSYKKGFEPRLGFALRQGDRWVFRGAYGISQYMEGTGANLRLPLNPPFFFESAVNYDATSGRQRYSKGLEYLASYTLSRTRSNNLGYYGSGGVAAEGAYWMNTYQPEWNYGPAFFDARHNLVLSANYDLPFLRGRSGTQSF